MYGVRPPSQRSRPRPQARIQIQSGMSSWSSVLSFAFSCRIPGHVLWYKLYINNEVLFLEHQQPETNNYAPRKVAAQISIETILSELGIEAGSKNLLTVNLRASEKRLGTKRYSRTSRCEDCSLTPSTFFKNVTQGLNHLVNSCYIDDDAVLLHFRHLAECR